MFGLKVMLLGEVTMKKFFSVIAVVGCGLTLAHATNISYNSVNSSSRLIDTEHPYLIDGTISALELNNNHTKFLESHPEYSEELELIKRQGSTVAPYIKFTKYIPNPNFKQPTTESKVTNSTATYPASRTLRLLSPALDQGNFGTCVTFATLGAISQQLFWYPSDPSPSCTLQMLRANGQDAWNGYFLISLFSYLNKYGWISETIGQSAYCNPSYVIYYPYGSTDQEYASLYPSLSNYSENSTKFTDYNIRYILDAFAALNHIKKELNDTTHSMVNGTPGYYPIFSFIVANNPYWFTGSDGNSYFTWVNFGYPRNNAGHEIFVYGYDDNLSINGQKGVLFLRNSWGNTGSAGNYVMTYDYFYNYYNADYILSFPYLNISSIKE